MDIKRAVDIKRAILGVSKRGSGPSQGGFRGLQGRLPSYGPFVFLLRVGVVDRVEKALKMMMMMMAMGKGEGLKMMMMKF